ncbi:putative potassium transport system protein kup [Corynebacterium deserti GIMN1.010]|uniref:Probable potassium transport system protein Kup n=1 Tax=Corynebacterium deserti GIMN1.010 TaxID=931089 RepID=A0A0M4CNN2_9CORY|nr:potassium transporter Kup [Corynebacterium deserti]ALC05180.1 putative potassium transport system protein kup [Corynebacterium deserti GIMN1.010]
MTKMRPESVAKQAPEKGHKGKNLLALGALGVVFGDIGTSPLYSLHTAFSMEHNSVDVTQANVYGIISMVLWTITLIVTVKYVVLMLRADNDGQGGILALVGLLKNRGTAGAFVAVAGMLGAALFYGDVLITPAISVLSATEGLTVISSRFESLVLPLSIIVLMVIFAIQPLGTEKVGRAFGPIMLVWFVVLAGLGIPQIIEHPEILNSLSPVWALRLVMADPMASFILLGAVVLTVTGAEALYADMGHFGAQAVRKAWFVVVMPSLIITYLGQGALVINHPEAVSNPMFYLAPESLRIPLIVLATVATVIASQAVISGAYSLTRQAVNLNLLPRMVIRHTSSHEEGQIYMPMVNGLLFVSVMVLVLVFRSSESLANAYGLAVTGTLVLASALFVLYARTAWQWAWWKVALFVVLIGVPEMLLFASNSTKIVAGGWLPLLVAAVLIVVMRTWQWGSASVATRREELEMATGEFLEKLDEKERSTTVGSGLKKVAEVAVFPHATRDTVPLSLVRCVKDLKLLYREIVIVRLIPENRPHVPQMERVTMEVLHKAPIRIVRLDVHVGYYEDHDLPRILHEVDPSWDDATYFLSALTLRSRLPGKIAGWRDRLYLSMERNQASRTEAFKLDPAKTISVGTEIHL